MSEVKEAIEERSVVEEAIGKVSEIEEVVREVSGIEGLVSEKFNSLLLSLQILFSETGVDLDF